MKLAHYDIELHCALLNTGYTHIHHEEEDCNEYSNGVFWTDVIRHNPAYDEYYSDQYRLIITENGIELNEYRDIVAEYYFDKHYANGDDYITMNAECQTIG